MALSERISAAQHPIREKLLIWEKTSGLVAWWSMHMAGDGKMLLAEETLTTQAIAGDAAALNRLLGRYDPRLRARLAPELGRLDGLVLDIDDVLQVTYTEAFLRIGVFERRGSGSFLAWLTQVAKHNIADAVREAGAKRRPPPRKRLQPNSDESYAFLLSSLPGGGSTPSRHVRRDEGKSLLEGAVSQLPMDYRTVVRLHDLEGGSAKDVAAAMGRSVPAIHMLKARAYARLAELLSESQFFSDSP